MSVENRQERVLVTGANGFVGAALVRDLVSRGVAVTAAARRSAVFPAGVREITIGDLGVATDWSTALADAHSVVHCAARVHVMRDTTDAPLTQYHRANVEGSLALARQAAAAGLRRFVFISSIKVHGESSPLGRPLTAFDRPAPVDSYGISKLEAERALAQVAAQTGLELVIIRPPLVYGPGVKANFLSMAHWIRRGVPLPLGRILENRRSFVAVENLLDLIVTCLRHPSAVGQTFLVSDGVDVSTTELLRRTAKALGVVPRLVPIPPALLEHAANFVGRPDLWKRIGGTLQVDISHTLSQLNWEPRVTLDEGLRRTVAHLVRTKAWSL